MNTYGKVLQIQFHKLFDFCLTPRCSVSIFPCLFYLFFSYRTHSASFKRFPPHLGVKEKRNEACLFGVYGIREEVNIISITFEPVNHQHNTEKHYCKRLTLPMRLELCDLPLCQRGGKQAKTWRRWEVNCALPASLSKQPLKRWWCFRQQCLNLGGGLMDAAPKVNEKNSIKLHHTAWGELHCFGWFIYWLFLPRHGRCHVNTHILAVCELHMCAPDTHQTWWIQRSSPRAWLLFYNQIPTPSSSWAFSNHMPDTSDGELNRDEWKDEGINKC